MKIYTTELVNEIIDKNNRGEKIPRSENIFYQSLANTRKSNLIFAMTPKEVDEWSNCKTDIYYFIEKYCKYTKEDGTYLDIKLLDYQKDLLDFYLNNRFTILMSSLQMGTTRIKALFFLHYLIFNFDKAILIIANKYANSNEIVQIIKKIYCTLPFFLKPGVRTWNDSGVQFDNGSGTYSMRKSNIAIGRNYDIVHIDEFAHIPTDIINSIYMALMPVLSSLKDSRMMIQSTPNGFNLFHELLQRAESIGESVYKSKRLYWWQYPGRDQTWKDEQIKIIGQSLFNQYYDFVCSVK